MTLTGDTVCLGVLAECGRLWPTTRWPRDAPEPTKTGRAVKFLSTFRLSLPLLALVNLLSCVLQARQRSNCSGEHWNLLLL